MEIAQVNGAWQQVASQRMAYGQQVSQGDVYGGGFQGGARSDAMMSGVMNRASAVGGPLGSAAIGMLGGSPMWAVQWALVARCGAALAWAGRRWPVALLHSAPCL